MMSIVRQVAFEKHEHPPPSLEHRVPTSLPPETRRRHAEVDQAAM